MCRDAITSPALACTEPATSLPPPALVADPDDFDPRDWIMANIELNDPVERRRNELRVRAEAAGFTDIDVRHLADPNGWEMRFHRGTNTECATAAEAERWLNYLAFGCQCEIDPGQFVAIVDGDRIAARFRLQPQPVPV
jgi:redox-sensitive bicupin YhaK (pirin superfamily)